MTGRGATGNRTDNNDSHYWRFRMRARDLFEMKSFVEVGELLSFARAAERLGVTPSAVSQSVRHLEVQVGTSLFLRTTRQVALTGAGERLMEELKPALAALERAHGALLDLSRQPPGPLRLTLPQVAAEQLVGPALPEFSRRFPAIEIELSIDNGFVDLLAQRFDAGIRRGGSVKQDMVAKRLSPDDRLVTVAAPAYVAAHGNPTHPKELRQHATIRIRQRSTRLLPPWRFSKGSACVLAKPSGRLIVDDPGLARDMAIAGMGIVRLARVYVQTALDRGDLQLVLASWHASLSGFFLYYRRESRASAPLRVFRDFMSERKGGGIAPG